MTDVVLRHALPSLPVWGQAQATFPVRRIYCVGQNYVAHALEMGASGREEPFFFTKPGDAVLPCPEQQTVAMHYPSLTHDLHHEVELVVAIGQGGRAISSQHAHQHIWGYAVGLDMTRRDLQRQAKALARPWSIAKGFDESAPLSAVRPKHLCSLSPQATISLAVNGQIRQHGTLGQLIWSVPEIIEKISQAWTLAPGDLIFTGTPSGVGTVVVGDTLHAQIEGVGELSVKIVAGADA